MSTLWQTGNNHLMEIIYLIGTLLAGAILFRASRRTDAIPDDAMVSVRQVIAGDRAIVCWRSREFTVRLHGIECADTARDVGQRARDGLLELIGGRRVAVETHRVTDAGHVVGTLSVLLPGQADWLDVNAEMVRNGHARAYRGKYENQPDHRYDELAQLESEARSRGLGLWQASILGGANAMTPPR
jgi:endonuclease YncB( thermonuclease family)